MPVVRSGRWRPNSSSSTTSPTPGCHASSRRATTPWRRGVASWWRWRWPHPAAGLPAAPRAPRPAVGAGLGHMGRRARRAPRPPRPQRARRPRGAGSTTCPSPPGRCSVAVRRDPEASAREHATTLERAWAPPSTSTWPCWGSAPTRTPPASSRAPAPPPPRHHHRRAPRSDRPGAAQPDRRCARPRPRGWVLVAGADKRACGGRSTPAVLEAGHARRRRRRRPAPHRVRPRGAITVFADRRGRSDRGGRTVDGRRRRRAVGANGAR
jgi:hypothetical protein